MKKLNLVKEVVYQLTLDQKRNVKGGSSDDDGPGTSRITRTKTKIRSVNAVTILNK